MNEIRTVYSHYAQFEGRSGRREYWTFFLFYLIACGVLSIIDNMMFGGPGGVSGGPGWSVTDGFQPLTSIFALVSLIPGIAVSVRRLHDTGKSGWWAAIGLIPLIGWIWLLFLCAAPGTPESNVYGEPPVGPSS